jgi:hypothetical protein
MTTSAIICVQCRRVVALGAALPATCLAAVPDADRRTLPGTDLDAHPAAHRDCVELEVTVPEGLATEELLAQIERTYAAQLAALGGLAERLAPPR